MGESYNLHRCKLYDSQGEWGLYNLHDPMTLRPELASLILAGDLVASYPENISFETALAVNCADSVPTN